MTRRRFLAFFGGLLAAVTAAFPVLRRPKTHNLGTTIQPLFGPPGTDALFTMDIGATRLNPDAVVQISQTPKWDGKITFESEAIVGGIHVEPGTTYYARPAGVERVEL